MKTTTTTTTPTTTLNNNNNNNTKHCKNKTININSFASFSGYSVTKTSLQASFLR